MRTRRLRLRALTGRDARRIATLAGDWEVARMTARIPYPYSQKLAEEWIEELDENDCVLGIIFRLRLVGACGFLRDGDVADIGYWIGKPWWGRGLATEAAGSLIEHCFETGCERITCGHFVDNPASARVIAKLGFRLIGRGKLWCDARQAEVETLRYERLRDPAAIGNARP